MKKAALLFRMGRLAAQRPNVTHAKTCSYTGNIASMVVQPVVQGEDGLWVN